MVGMAKMIRGILLSGTFDGSWFITAAVTDVIIVYFLSKKLSNKWILSIGLLGFLVCCIDSNYCRLFFYDDCLENLYYNSHRFITYPRYTFIAGLLWVALGKCFAQKPIFANKRFWGFLSISSLLLLFAEDALVRMMQWPSDSNTCYLSFIPICLSIFVWMGVSDFKVPYSKVLRKLSTMIYCLHLSVIYWLKELTVLDKYLVFGTALLISASISLLIICLQKRPKLNWLKYAY